KSPAIPFQFRGSDRAPFSSAIAAAKKTSGGDKIVRSKLSLNGILMKEKPLAILADESGATAICAVGDTFFSQIIVAIRGNTVTLRDAKGAYDLSVIEK
ncbi:MAG: hypothetical protein PHC61_12665, partial [Chitinivibrionales bacterium]|nr:hypothetical protein [Chitinivibrionales bacterium]